MQEVADLISPATMDGMLYLAGKTRLIGRVANKFTLGNATFRKGLAAVCLYQADGLGTRSGNIRYHYPRSG